MRRRNLLLPAVFAVWLLSCSGASACHVPVFRYALERWRPDCYEAIVFHRGPLTAEQQKLIADMRDAAENQPGAANVTPQTVDLAGDVAADRHKLWQAQANPVLPWMVVRYPASLRLSASVWAGPINPANVQTLLQSPVRREIARRLLQGDSVVYLLLESGDRPKDDAAAQLLTSKLKALEKTLKLPGDDPTEEAKPAKDDKDASGLLSKLPLQIKLSVLRLSRTDPAEKMFTAMLVNANDEIAQAKGEPILFPIFGRGRALDAFVGHEITAAKIAEVATFLCGACSCTVKALNPGVDMLFSADWDQLLEDGNEVAEPASAKPGVGVPIPQPSVASTESAVEPPAVAVEANPHVGSHRYLWLGIGTAGLLMVVTGIIALRSKKQSP